MLPAPPPICVGSLDRRRALSFLLLSALAFGCKGGGGGGTPDATPTPPKTDPRKNFAPSGSLGLLQVINRTDATGRAFADVVVPVEKGHFFQTPNARTADDRVCQIFPMGARNADESFRYFRLEVPVTSTPRQSQELEVLFTDRENPPFVRHPAIQDPIGAVIRMKARGTMTAFPTPTVIETGPLSETYRSRLRVPDSMVWAELTVTVYSGEPQARFTLQWGVSDPRTTAMHEDPGPVELHVEFPTNANTADAHVEFEQEKAKVLELRSEGATTVAVLHRAGNVGDGQSQLVAGRLVFFAGSPPRVFAISKLWPAREAFGPFGVLMPELRVNPAAFAALVAQDELKHDNHPWAAPVHGCNPSPTNAGSQADFGNTMMRADVILADPSRLQTILRSVYQEACRPTHFREVDVSRVRVANHPKLWTNSGRPKTEGSGTDLLGKNPNARITNSMLAPNGSKWRGHNGPHLSLNYLGSIALLTGNRFAREEIEHHCMLYLTGFTFESGSFNDQPGTAAQVGRANLAALWLWLVSGREDVQQRIKDRATVLADKIAGQSYALDIIRARGSGTEWSVWEEANGVTGLAAVHRQLGSPEALQVAQKVSRSVVMNGYARLKTGGWRAGFRLPIQTASGTPYVARLDPGFDNRAAGGGLTMWGMPAVFFAAESHPDATVRAQALEILREEYGGPIDGLEPVLEWIGVSAEVPALAELKSGS